MKNKIIIEHIEKKNTNLTYYVKKNESVTVVVLVQGEKNYRINLTLNLEGTGSEGTIIGLVHASKNASIIFHTLQHHAAINTTSNLLVKSILTDSSFLSYEGGIVVDKIAQKTNAYQRNENLLLDESAHAKSKPALEILANDVRCTHGATIGTLDPEQLWYLATRGIGKGEGRKLISNGFLMSALKNLDETDKIKINKEFIFYG